MDDNKTKAIGKPSQESTPSVKMGKNYILAIGIRDYKHHSVLPNAVKDATGFAQVMTTRYGFEHLHKPLFNEDATRHRLPLWILKNRGWCCHEAVLNWFQMATSACECVVGRQLRRSRRIFF